MFAELAASGFSAQVRIECAALVSTGVYRDEKVSVTEEFIGMLGGALEDPTVRDDFFSQFYEKLELGEITNLIPYEKSRQKSAWHHHYETLEIYVQSEELDLSQVSKWAKAFLEKYRGEGIKREEARVETEDLRHRFIWHKIPAGGFWMGEHEEIAKAIAGRDFDQNEAKFVTFDHAKEVMSSKVTQKMWVELMGENPSHFASGEHSITIQKNGEAIEVQPDNPVESITWWSALEFANRLSKAQGLEPVYDLSAIKWEKDTSAEAGTWRPEDDKDAKIKLRINAPNGDIYLAKGFRLPTAEDQEYLYRNLGTANGEYPHDITEEELRDYAWFEGNAGSKTHPVGTTPKSFYINGQEFLDLIGNVWEWSHTPTMPMGFSRVCRGGSWIYDLRGLRSAYRNDYSRPGFGLYTLGFRLWRTILPDEVKSK